jgi:hypothetical protein
MNLESLRSMLFVSTRKNHQERDSQVALIADIFRSANRVVVWLGLPADGSSHVLQLVRNLTSKLEFDEKLREFRPSVSAKSEPHWADVTLQLPYEKWEWLAISKFVHRPWFERIWVRQEIGLAKANAVVTCGFDAIS